MERAAYQNLLDCPQKGDAAGFDALTMGGNVPLVNPQAGLAFDMEVRIQTLAIGTPPAVASAHCAGEMVELSWMALLRDISSSDYGTNSNAQTAIAELSKLCVYRGPKESGKVTANTLFRGFAPGDTTGLYVSQFLLKPFEYGTIPVENLGLVSRANGVNLSA